MPCTTKKMGLYSVVTICLSVGTTMFWCRAESVLLNKARVYLTEQKSSNFCLKMAANFHKFER